MLIEVLLRSEAAAEVSDRLFRPTETLHAPQLIDLEVAQALRRHERFGDLSVERGREAIEDLAQFPVERYLHVPLLPRIWELRDNASAYDAIYLALAEALDAPLLTCDRALRSIPGHGAEVQVVG